MIPYRQSMTVLTFDRNNAKRMVWISGVIQIVISLHHVTLGFITNHFTRLIGIKNHTTNRTIIDLSSKHRKKLPM